MKVPASIFSREFKHAFNSNKYMDYTKRVQDSHTHLNFYSHWDLKMGRFMFTFAATFFALVFYHDPGYIHETVFYLNRLVI